jgi:poly(A) polymerase
MKDIRAKQVRPIIPLATIFIDDPVRMIRAVKYSAATGFSLPLPLKWKIKKQSPLLASISPSRLTEEIFKIVHSSQAAAIVEALDDMGLYAYLQPQAAALMKTNPRFRRHYLKSMAALNQPDFKNLPGETLGALINDHLEDIADWEQGVVENYRLCYTAARSFVRPMNPPRFELGYAVRRFFAAHGVTVKKSHAAGLTPAGEAEGAAAEVVRRKRRRRKRRSKNAGTDQQSL